MSEHVGVELRDAVQWIRLQRPEKKNAITFEMYEAMVAGLAAARTDPAVRVACITGSGDAFSSGADVKSFVDRPARAGKRPPQRFIEAVASFDKPLVAAVNGFAVGIGATMLLHCDLVYASTEAIFRFPFVDLGLVPEAGSSLLLPRLAGHHRACELLMMAEKFDAHTALQIGLVNALAAPSELIARVSERAARLAAKPPAALRATKALIRAARPDPGEQMQREFDLFEERLRSPEAREAASAFLERRPPDFSRFD